MLDTSELFKANFRNMEALKKINILNDLSKVNFGFKENTNGINEAFKKINILNDLSKVNFGFKETLKNFSQMTEIRNQLLLSKYKNFDVFKNNSMMFVLPNLYRKLNTIHKFNLNLLTQNYAKATKPELRVFEQDIISTELALQSPLKQQQIKHDTTDILSLCSETEQCLNNIHPRFALMYRGALDTYLGNNVEKPRYVFTSIKELLIHLLNKIAPNNEVEDWIDSKPGSNDEKISLYYYKGKLTRKTKIRYFFRQEENGFLAKVAANKDSLLESIINKINSLHKLNLDVVENDLKKCILSTKYIIDYICCHYQKYNQTK